MELYNASDRVVALANFVPADLVIAPGAYLRIELDKNGWPGFALGRDEAFGIWSIDGGLVEADWNEEQADAGTSFARMPDITGHSQTVPTPTPGAPNR